MALELKQQIMTNKLAPNPLKEPKYSLSISSAKGKEEKLADPKATRALLALMNQHAVIGGAACHWGGPSAFAEIMSSLHTIMFRENDWRESYHFVNDAGHAENGIYALRANYEFAGMGLDSLKGFRSIESKLTGHGEAHINPEGVFISNGPLGSGLPQAQGLALGDRLLRKERTTICTLSDGGAMEGEARESLAAIPGLAKKEKMNPFVLIISDNNTKLSGRIEDDSFSMTPSFDSLSTLGWDMTVIKDGHNLDEVHKIIDQRIEMAKADPTKPQAVIVKTVKGVGVKSTEESSSGGHGYPLKAYDENLISFIQEIYQGNAPKEFIDWADSILESRPKEKSSSQASEVKKEKVQPGFSRAVIEATKNGAPVVSVCADLQGSTGIALFHKEFPERKIDIGIAESNMVSTAIGLSKLGMIPIVDTFSQFGVTKGNLPLIMAGLSQGPIIGLFSHIGFQDAADGASHQSTTYLSAVSSIPHVQSIVCSCSDEAYAYMTEAIAYFTKTREQGKVPDSILFFLGRENFPMHYKKDLDYQWGKAQILKSGSNTVLVAIGPHVPKALEAAALLKEQGQDVSVVNMPFVNRPDTETIAQLLGNNGNLVTIEDHQVMGGMGSILSHALLLEGKTFKLRSIGNSGEFGQSAYKADELYDSRGMGVRDIVKACQSF